MHIERGDGRVVAIRPEQAGDLDAIRAVNLAAFAPSDDEARLVDRLRANGNATISLVALIDGAVVGHILFSPVELEAQDRIRAGLGLAPLGVLPPFQNQGIGSMLVEAGLAECRSRGVPFVVVLGHPRFYARFGFRRASALEIRNEYGADEAFLVHTFECGESADLAGLARYGAEFSQWAES